MEKVQERKNNWYREQATHFEGNRYGALALMITAQSCWGSVAAMYGLMNDSFVSLGVAAVVTLASNAVFIAQSPARWCIHAFYFCIAINTIVVLLNLFF